MANGFDGGNGGPPSPRPGGPGMKPPMSKKTKNWLIIGGVGAAGIVIWYIMRNRSQAATDPSLDPNAAAADAYGGYGVSGYGSNIPSQFGYYDPTTGAYITGSGIPGSVVTAPSTNAAWAQQVEAYLQGLGYDPTAVGNAIGRYLAGMHLTQTQSGIVAAAKAFFGNPPGGAPPIVVNPPGGQATPKSYSRLGVKKAETLQQFAREHHWTDRTLKLVEAINKLGPRSKLRKGQTIIRPEWN